MIEHFGWGFNGTSIGIYEEQIPNHYCSDQELGLDRDNEEGSNSSLVFPTHRSAIPELRIYRKKFKCIDRKDLLIWGDYNSAST